jgi:hypothetical protein
VVLVECWWPVLRAQVLPQVLPLALMGLPAPRRRCTASQRHGPEPHERARRRSAQPISRDRVVERVVATGPRFRSR